MDVPYVAPAFNKDGFNCPFCNAFATQEWGQPRLYANNANHGQHPDYWTCRCGRCEKFSFWISKKMVYPAVSTIPGPNNDLPDEIKDDYQEAASIATLSPRGASALLRLAIQKLCVYLGEDSKNINADIGALVKKGLPAQIQQSLDIVRVVGNNAVHPGQIDFEDNDQSIASKLFGLVNLIAEVMISQPKHVAEMYEAIVPEPQRTAIQERDAT